MTGRERGNRQTERVKKEIKDRRYIRERGLKREREREEVDKERES